MIFVLVFVDVVYDVDEFLSIVPFLHAWNKSQLIMIEQCLAHVTQ